MKTSMLQMVRELIKCSPRFGPGEVKTANYIRKLLEINLIQFIDQKYSMKVPFPKRVTFQVDGKEIDCRNVGMKSGIIDSKDNVISSLMWSDNDFYYPKNINFNPFSKNTISMAMYYKNAAIAIDKKDLSKVVNANKIFAEVIVEPYVFKGSNFLVGNVKNPKNIIFTHYDCWETGAIDNASGTAVVLDICINNKELLSENLFVIAGSEEISFDEPIYWGKGYRVFQKKYSQQVNIAEKLVVIDCVGYSKHEFVTDSTHVHLGLPLKNFNELSKKSSMLCGDFSKLMEVYHSDNDNVSLLSEVQLIDAKQMLIKFVSN